MDSTEGRGGGKGEEEGRRRSERERKQHRDACHQYLQYNIHCTCIRLRIAQGIEMNDDIYIHLYTKYVRMVADCRTYVSNAGCSIAVVI